MRYLSPLLLLVALSFSSSLKLGKSWNEENYLNFLELLKENKWKCNDRGQALIADYCESDADCRSNFCELNEVDIDGEMKTNRCLPHAREGDHCTCNEDCWTANCTYDLEKKGYFCGGKYA